MAKQNLVVCQKLNHEFGNSGKGDQIQSQKQITF